ncbi:MAG: nitrile hydratase subunit beta [Marinosulfonomonas sp.]|nr:nitrile hydratase subunit beta [Marinosulfonomonas sp.]
MDTVHDLGGKDGFGVVDVHDSGKPFEHDWEGRMWALSRSSRLPSLTIDWWRHVVERIPPAAHMSIPYFEKWCLTELACYVDAGEFTLEEAVSGHTEQQADAGKPATVADVIASNRASAKTFEVVADVEAAFNVGHRVETRSHSVATHTRLPAYARGRVGKVLAQRGAHPLADDSAQGVETPQHLYTVEFSARELWGDDASPHDTVALDLWESYLVST